MNAAERAAYERPNADRHIDFAAFGGQVVTVAMHSDFAPGNCKILAGTLTRMPSGGWLVSANDHTGSTVPEERVIRIERRDPTWPQGC